MVDIKKELNTFLGGKRIYIYVVEGGGTGNEAAAFRMGTYLETSFENVEVCYLMGLLPSTTGNTTNFADYPLDINTATLEKMKKLGVQEGKIIQRTKDLPNDKYFIVTCAADGSESNAVAVETFLEKLKKTEKYLGFINLEPFAWNSNNRFIRFAGNNYPLNLPKLADYPDLTVSTTGSTSSTPTIGSSLISLLEKRGGPQYDVMVTYGLHALYDSDDGTNALDEEHCFWVARAFAALAVGVANYVVQKSKKHTILLALHPKNQFDAQYIRVTEHGIVTYADVKIPEQIKTPPGTIHYIPINHASLSALIEKIIQAKDPQLIVLYKTDDVVITPNEFSRLLDMTTLPTVSEGANTIGQLYSKKKAFFTVGNATLQVVNISEEIDASNKWFNLVNASTGEGKIKKSAVTYSSDGVKTKLEGIRNTLFFSDTSISTRSFTKFNKEIAYRDILLKAAGVITEELSSAQYQEYVEHIHAIKSAYPDYIGNQVLLSFYLFFLAGKEKDILKKIQ